MPRGLRWARWLRTLLQNPQKRLSLTLLFSLALGALYALFQLASGIFYRGRWLYALALYDALLTALRLSLFLDLTKGAGARPAWRHYQLYGAALLALMPLLALTVHLAVRAESTLTPRGVVARTVCLVTLDRKSVV